MRLIEVEGKPYDLGYQHGTQCRSEINRVLHNTYNILSYVTGHTRGQCIKKAKPLINKVKDMTPDLCDEIEGIAKGAKVDFNDIFMLNAIPEVTGIIRGACTVISVGSEYIEEKKSISAQTIDWNPSLEDQYVILKIKPEKGPQILAYTCAGILALIGKNTSGISLFLNILLTNEEISQGLPAYFLLRQILEQERIGDALNVVISQERASPFNYFIIDDDGEAYNIEATPAEYDILPNLNGIFVHTNHMLSPKLRHKDVYVKVARNPETVTRYYRIKKLLDQLLKSKGKIGLKDIIELLKDHSNYPDSVCRHPNENIGPVQLQYKTLAAMITKEGEKGIFVNYGNPCKGKFLKYS